MVQELEKGKISAISTSDDQTDGYYLVKWTQDPYMAEEDFTTEDGTLVKKGQYASKGIYLYEIPGGKDWYAEKDVTGGVPINLPVDIAVRHVVLSEVDFQGESIALELPTSMKKKIKELARASRCKHLRKESKEEIERQIDRRERLIKKVHDQEAVDARRRAAAAQEAVIVDTSSSEEDDSSDEEEDGSE